MSTVTEWSQAGFADGISCNLVPNVILKGANIAPKTGQSFQDFFLEWDWNGWIKPQIDALSSIGGNTVRLIGDIAGVNNGTFTQSYYDAKWSQLITYADSLGLYVYPAGGGVSQIGSLSVSEVADTVATAADNWDDYSNVVGIDILQESVRAQTSGSYALSYPEELTTPVRAVTSKPLTFSNSCPEPFGMARMAFPLWREVLRPYVDFWDIHVYTQCPPAMIFQAFWAQGETKPIVIGEFGIEQSQSVVNQTRQYQTVAKVASERYYGLHIAGVLQWAIFPQSDTASNDFGIFDNTGNPRTHLTDVFQELPTV
jgi:hypothetical protein